MTASKRNTFHPLKISSLQAETGFQHPYYLQANPVKVGSSALEVMTDLRFMPAATCSENDNVLAARQNMIARSVRLLLVANLHGHIIGLITSHDLAGDRMAAITQSEGRAQDLVSVGEVMTPAEGIEVLEFDDVLHAYVGDIIETLKCSGRQHALVIDRSSMDDSQTIRAIFSASQIARQLGVSTSSFDLAGTFSELDAELKKASV
jgi:CBS-domain-containing membrane protein